MQTSIPKTTRLSNAGGTVALEAVAGDSKLKRFMMEAYTGKVVDRWYGRLVFDLAGMNPAAKSFPILRGHNDDEILGHTTSVTISASQSTVILEGVLSGCAEDVNPIIETSANGFPWQASIGCSIDSVLYLPDEKSKLTVNGREVSGPCYVATKSTLLESSFVPIGADSETSSQVLSNQPDGNTVTVERFAMAEQAPPAVPIPAPDLTKLAKDAETKGALDAQTNDRARLAALKAKFPGETDFVLAQYELGHDTLKASEAFVEILKGRIAAKPNGAQPVSRIAQDAPAPASTLDAGDHKGRAELEWADPKNRAGFTSKENYIAVRSAQLSGKLRTRGTFVVPEHDAPR